MENKIAETRIILDVTQEELANGIGISRPHLSEIENNKRNPSTSIAIKIANFLGVKVEEIFFDKTVRRAEQ